MTLAVVKDILRAVNFFSDIQQGYESFTKNWSETMENYKR